MLPYSCPRCLTSFENQTALSDHIRISSDEICAPERGSTTNPEDGIDFKNR